MAVDLAADPPKRDVRPNARNLPDLAEAAVGLLVVETDLELEYGRAAVKYLVGLRATQPSPPLGLTDHKMQALRRQAVAALAYKGVVVRW